MIIDKKKWSKVIRLQRRKKKITIIWNFKRWMLRFSDKVQYNKLLLYKFFNNIIFLYILKLKNNSWFKFVLIIFLSYHNIS